MQKLKRIIACLSLLALTTAFVSCSYVKVIVKDIEITEAVDSKYVQPNDLDLVYVKINDSNEEYLRIRRIKATKEEINIAPKYGDYEVREFSLDFYDLNGKPFENTTTKKIILPDTIKKMDAIMIDNYRNLEEIVLPKGLTEMINFRSSPTLKKIEISSENKKFKVENNKLFDVENNRLIKAFNLESDSITINGFKEISEFAITETNLSEIVFEEGVEEISGSSIRYNDKLTSITLPSTFKGFVEDYDFGFGYNINALINYDIFDTNDNLKTIYNYSNVELDLSRYEIEVIKMTK